MKFFYVLKWKMLWFQISLLAVHQIPMLNEVQILTKSQKFYKHFLLEQSMVPLLLLLVCINTRTIYYTNLYPNPNQEAIFERQSQLPKENVKVQEMKLLYPPIEVGEKIIYLEIKIWQYFPFHFPNIETAIRQLKVSTSGCSSTPIFTVVPRQRPYQGMYNIYLTFPDQNPTKSFNITFSYNYNHIQSQMVVNLRIAKMQTMSMVRPPIENNGSSIRLIINIGHKYENLDIKTARSLLKVSTSGCSSTPNLSIWPHPEPNRDIYDIMLMFSDRNPPDAFYVMAFYNFKGYKGKMQFEVPAFNKQMSMVRPPTEINDSSIKLTINIGHKYEDLDIKTAQSLLKVSTSGCSSTPKFQITPHPKPDQDIYDIVLMFPDRNPTNAFSLITKYNFTGYRGQMQVKVPAFERKMQMSTVWRPRQTNASSIKFTINIGHKYENLDIQTAESLLKVSTSGCSSTPWVVITPRPKPNQDIYDIVLMFRGGQIPESFNINCSYKYNGYKGQMQLDY